MTITPFEVYLITRASAINTMFILLTGAFLFISIVVVPAFCDCYKHEEDKAKIAKRFYTVLLPLLAFSILGAVFTPRTKDLAAIIAIPAIVNSNITQEKVPEALNGIFDLAEAWLEELKPEETP